MRYRLGPVGITLSLAVIGMALILFYWITSTDSFFFKFTDVTEVSNFIDQNFQRYNLTLAESLVKIQEFLSKDEGCTPVYIRNGQSIFTCYVRAERPAIYGGWRFKIDFIFENSIIVNNIVEGRWFGW